MLAFFVDVLSRLKVLSRSFWRRTLCTSGQQYVCGVGYSGPHDKWRMDSWGATYLVIVDNNIIRAVKSRRWLYNQIEIQIQEPPTELTGIVRKARDEDVNDHQAVPTRLPPWNRPVGRKKCFESGRTHPANLNAESTRNLRNTDAVWLRDHEHRTKWTLLCPWHCSSGQVLRRFAIW